MSLGTRRFLLSSVLVAGLVPTSWAGAATGDGGFEGGGRVTAGSVTELRVAGRGGVPDDATSVVLNITVTDPSGPGYVTVYPCDVDRPNTSTVNYLAGDTVPNAAVAPLAADGSVCLFSSASAQLIVDVNGYFGPDSAVAPIGPARLLDSRTGPVSETIDGDYRGDGPYQAGWTTGVDVSGRAGMRSPRIALLNVTVTEPEAAGYVTVWSGDFRRPTASNLNYAAGQTIANLVYANVGSSVLIYTTARTHLVVDVVGYLDEPAGVKAKSSRLLDSRLGDVSDTIDDEFDDLGVLPPRTTTKLQIRGRVTLANGMEAAVLNVAVTEPDAPGFVTVFPCDAPLPVTSNVNHRAGQTISNTVIAPVGPDGTVCLFNTAATHLVVDAYGWIPPEAGYEPLTPARLLDTRPVVPNWRRYSVDADGLESRWNEVVDIECVATGSCYVPTRSPLNFGFDPYIAMTADGRSWTETERIGGQDDVPTAIDCPSEDVCYVTIYPYSDNAEVVVTRDGFATWSRSTISTGSEWMVAPSSITCPTDDVCFVHEGEQIFRTDDAGAHWVLVTSDIGRKGRFPELQCPTVDVCFTASQSQFLRSTDGGATWDVVLGTTIGEPSHEIHAFDCTAATICHLVASVRDESAITESFVTTYSAGNGWIERDMPGRAWALECTGPRTCVVLTGTGEYEILHTGNSGATWNGRFGVQMGSYLSCAGTEVCMTMTARDFADAIVEVGSPP